MARNLCDANLVIRTSILIRLVLMWAIAAALVLIAAPAYSQEQNRARILVRAIAKIEVRTEIFAPIISIPFTDGEKFIRDDVLIKFDCSRYEAEQSAASAAARASGIEHRTKRKLLKFKAVGKDEVKLAAAISEKAHAELKVHQLKTAQCEFKAPFDGRIVTRHVNENEFPASDKPLLTILDDGKLELQLVVPSIWMRWIEVDQQFKFEIDETGESYQGEIIRLGAEVDPVSQTIIITGKFKSDNKHVLAGMSGTAYFDAGS